MLINEARVVSIQVHSFFHAGEVRNIEDHMRPVIAEVYERFLIDSADQEELEYATFDQEIEVNLIHRNYASPKDIKICLGFDIQALCNHPNFGVIEGLHRSLSAAYADSELAD